MSLLRIPYPAQGHEPAWFTPTARVNFCEEDYLVTPYIAEFFNTITNVSYVIYAWHGIRRLRGKSDALLLSLPYIGLAAVGVLSGAFHATLTYWGQMSDDISMIFATAFVLHRAYSAGRSARWSRNFGGVIAAAFVAFAAYHAYTDELLVHGLLFGGMTAAVAVKTRALIRRVHEGDREKERRLKVAAKVGALCAAVGYALWNVDQHLCGGLTRVRRAVGQPWGWALELHGWWHVLTAVGAYTFMALVEVLTTEEEGDRGRGRVPFAWPVDAYLGRRDGEVKKE